MKITNITKVSSKLSQELRLPLRKRGGLNFTVILKPGDSIFLEERNNNNVVRIYEKKKYLSVTNEKPIGSQSYYVVYTEAALNNTKQDIPVVKATKQVKVEVQKENLSNETESNQESEIIEVEIIVPEESVNKSKGGRPKGSKNKSKRGRPKSKKSVGRPKKSKKK
tara:strand:- start:1485 stop:1982 length:498 start_codon:yes stop_codon:yes gene_type:complete